MKMKFGALVVDGRGKIGGHVASKNRAGAYLRTKVTPVNPQTSAQTLVRSRLAGLSSGWRALTQEQRNSWNGAVENFSKTDIFGDVKNPSGVNLYQRLNNELLSIGVAPIDVAPLPEEVPTVVLQESSVLVGALGTITLLLSGAVPEGVSAKIFATPGMSPGINFVKSEFRQIGVEAAAATSPLDVTEDYEAKFGPAVAGLKYFFKIVFVNTTTGQSSPGQIVSSIAAEA